MKILALFHSKIFCKNQGNFTDKMLTEKIGLVPIITASLLWWSNVLVRWSKYQINSYRGVLQKLYNFRWLAASLWEKLDTTAQSVFDRSDSWTGKVYRHLAAKRRTYTVKSPIVATRTLRVNTLTQKPLNILQICCYVFFSIYRLVLDLKLIFLYRIGSNMTGWGHFEFRWDVFFRILIIGRYFSLELILCIQIIMMLCLAFKCCTVWESSTNSSVSQDREKSNCFVFVLLWESTIFANGEKCAD